MSTSDSRDARFTERNTPKESASREEKDRGDHPVNEDLVPDSNPPRTTTDGLTAPKFGSAGSGGAEFEPGPEKD